jgi:4-diphosphocytidyl-2-C-methyl-D-erythritol kinase
MLQEIVLEAPAKVNLTLDVKGKRPDGYHELETVMHQIDLADIIELRARPEGITVNSDNPLLPSNGENLAYQAADLLLNPIGKGVDISIKKNIPVGAGLAGGSTDAAAVMLGLNDLYGLGLDKQALLEQGALIGSDVPFCMTGGTALARGRGEILTPLASGRRLNMLLVKPPFAVSTAEVYQALNLASADRRPDNTAFLDAWRKYDIINIACHLGNILESVSIKMYPIIEDIRQEMLDQGALGAVMSGSGPTVVGVFAQQETAATACQWFKNRYEEVYLVTSYVRGDTNGG